MAFFLLPSRNALRIYPAYRLASKPLIFYRDKCNLHDDKNHLLPRFTNLGLPIRDLIQLSKLRLTILVTATSAGGYLMCSSFSAGSFISCIIGTALLSSSACTLNNILEIPYDAQMPRTRSRALVRNRLSPLQAFLFAGSSAFTGLGILCLGCCPLSSGLGALNLGIYSFLYTPLKRRHISCTWAGAVVGAIPPLIGYSAATGYLDLNSLLLAGILYSWQFPHFNGLSWNLRFDYKKAGYKMMCTINERLCRTTTLRHSIALLGFSTISPLFSIVDERFALYSLPFNALMVYYSYKFYKGPTFENSRKLFRFTLMYLPPILLLMVFLRDGSKHNFENPFFGFGGNRQKLNFDMLDLKEPASL